MPGPLEITILQDEGQPPGYAVLRITGVERAPLDDSFTVRRADSEALPIGSDWPSGRQQPVSSEWNAERQVLDLAVGPAMVNAIPGGTPVVIRLAGLGDQDIAVTWPDGLLLEAKLNRRRGRPRNEVVESHHDEAGPAAGRVRMPPLEADAEAAARQREHEASQREALRRQEEAAVEARRLAEDKRRRDTEAERQRAEEIERQRAAEKERESKASAERERRTAPEEALAKAGFANLPAPAARSNRTGLFVLLGLVLLALMIGAYLVAVRGPKQADARPVPSPTPAPAPARESMPAPAPAPAMAPPAPAEPGSCSQKDAEAGLCRLAH